MTSITKKKKLLAIASGGGHWKQLMRLKPLFDEESTLYITTIAGLSEQSGVVNSKVVNDFSRTEKIALIKGVINIGLIVFKYKPDVVITTGAAPGLIAIIIGRLVGSRTLWIDSIANGDELSMSGRMAKGIAHQTISQWSNVALKDGVEYWGKLL